MQPNPKKVWLMLAHTLLSQLSQLMPNHSHTIHRHRVQCSDCDWDATTFRPAEVSKTATSLLPARARFHSIDSQTLRMPSHSQQQDPCSMLTRVQQHPDEMLCNPPAARAGGRQADAQPVHQHSWILGQQWGLLAEVKPRQRAWDRT